MEDKGTLVLTATAGKPGEDIYIDGGRILVRVISIEGKQVKLGIRAPRDVCVDREKVHKRKMVDTEG